MNKVSKKDIIIIVILLAIWTVAIIMVGKGVKKLKNTFFPEKTTEVATDGRVVALEEEIAELRNLITQQNGNAVAEETSKQEVPEEQATDTTPDEEQTEVQQHEEGQIVDSEYVVILPYGTEIYQMGYDVYDIIYLSDYLSESNGYLTRRPYDAEDKEVWCPEDSAVLRERNTGKCKLIVFQGFGTRPE